jgi:MEDS: MEthanogen/methylotroph, DcmR Sensory domain
MDWTATGGSHFDNLVEFESRVNDVWCRHNDAVICVYDLAKFGGDTVIDIMRTHPMIIIGGILQQYSFFIPPAQFVRELRERLPGGTCHARCRLDMELQCEDPTEENKRLQHCINDLVSVLALPALWSGGAPSQVVRALLDMLQGMLRLDFVYVRLNDPIGETPCEMLRVTQSQKPPIEPQQISKVVNDWLGDDPRKLPAAMTSPIGDRDISIVPLQLA